MKPDALRARALAEWRGTPYAPFVRDQARPIGETLAQVVTTLGLEDRLKEHEVLQAWRDIVGDFIAAHSTPHRLRDGVLYVRVLQSTVHYELDRIWKPQIVQKLKKRFGARTVREVKFRLG